MKIRRILNSKREKKNRISNFFLSLKNISAKNKTIVICLDNTNRSYLGCVKVTYRLFPKNTILIPSYYSNVLLSENEKLKFCNEIIKLEFEQIIISGHPESLNFIVDNCHDQIKIKTVFYGTLSELIEEKNSLQFLNILKYLDEGKLLSIAYNKAGLAEWTNNMYNFKSYFLQLFSEIKPLARENNKIKKIGVLGAPNYNKNIINAISAALLIENTEIHTFTKVDFLDDKFKNRIINYEMLSDEEFEKLRDSMDLNIHISFSEGSGGQIFIDSLASGIPCITSFNNDYLLGNKNLSKLLIIDQYDNPNIIKNYISKVLMEDQSRLSKEIIEHVKLKNKQGVELLDAFVKSN